MTRGRLAIHAHFYQPERRDPFGRPSRPDPSAAPYASWNERVDAECYRPNAELGNLDRISFDIGPTLTTWLAEEDPPTLARMAAADHGTNAVAQGYHHSILPLLSARDRRTEVRWGLRDFALRFGRPATVFWLPEAAVDTEILRVLADEGVQATILAPWQAATPGLETRQLHRVDLGGGRTLIVAFYDGPLSGAVSFQPESTSDADRFAREWVLPRTSAPLHRDASPHWRAGTPLVLLATDGELYGHHQRFRDLFLQRLVDPAVDRGYDLVTLGEVLAATEAATLPRVTIADRTSWSCHHGILRWSAACACTPDGRWKQPLRDAFERLAGAIDAISEARAAALPVAGGAGRGTEASGRGATRSGTETSGRSATRSGTETSGRRAAAAGPGAGASGPGPLDLWAARDAWVDVVLEVETAAGLSARFLGERAPAAARGELETILEAQRWRLAMFASCGWYWEDPDRPETRQVLRSAARAARLVDGLAGTQLERRLLDDLALLRSPARGIDGAAIYREALAEVGQPA